jgi:hypothetical protein
VSRVHAARAGEGEAPPRTARVRHAPPPAPTVAPRSSPGGAPQPRGAHTAALAPPLPWSEPPAQLCHPEDGARPPLSAPTLARCPCAQAQAQQGALQVCARRVQQVQKIADPQPITVQSRTVPSGSWPTTSCSRPDVGQPMLPSRRGQRDDAALEFASLPSPLRQALHYEVSYAWACSCQDVHVVNASHAAACEACAMPPWHGHDERHPEKTATASADDLHIVG